MDWIGSLAEIMTMREDLLNWSRMDPRPNFYYHARSNTVVCYWQGIVMTQTQALLVVSGAWGLTYPTPAMKQQVFDEFMRAYYLGAFGNPSWSSMIDSLDPASHQSILIRWLHRNNDNLFKDLTNTYTIQEALGWFTKDRVQMID